MASGALATALTGLLVFTTVPPSETPSPDSKTGAVAPEAPTPAPEHEEDSASTPEPSPDADPTPSTVAQPESPPSENAPDAVEQNPRQGVVDFDADDVALASDAPARPVDPVVDGAPVPNPGSVLDERRDPHRRFFLAGGIAASLVGLGLGAVGIVGAVESNRLEGDAGRQEDRDAWRTTAIVTGAVGAAFLLTGLTLTGLALTRTPVRVRATAGRGATGVSISGRF